MTLCGQSRKEAARPTPLLTPRTITRVVTWSVRTMFEAGRTHQVAREMRNYNIRGLGLSETRWLQKGQLRFSTEEQLLYSLALMLAHEAQRTLIGWEPVNSRITTAKFTTKKKDFRLTIIQCYAPINDAEGEKKVDFYQQLQREINKGGAKDMTILMADFNAKIGSDNTGY